MIDTLQTIVVALVTFATALRMDGTYNRLVFLALIDSGPGDVLDAIYV